LLSGVWTLDAEGKGGMASDGLNGIEVAELFFEEFGLPTIKRHFPDMIGRVSAGLLGIGSELLGADDEFSRDHGWGPRFNLFLSERDFQSFGRAMEEKLNELRPEEFHGVVAAKSRTDPIRVSTVDRHFSEYTGSALPPETVQDWLLADENRLRYAQEGRVFYDPVGELTARVRAFSEAYYPEDVWLWRIASRAYRMWHYGSYNLCCRLAQRNDGVGILMASGRFVQAALQLAFLLNRSFAPYWKWLHWDFCHLPYLADRAGRLLQELVDQPDVKRKATVVGKLCEIYLHALHERGILPDSEWRSFIGSFEIVDNKIRDPEVKRFIQEHHAAHGGL
jgi:hypothetical protein